MMKETIREEQMAIPMVDPRAEYLSMKAEIDKAILGVLARNVYVLGYEVLLFEREFAEFCQAREAVAVASGADALYLALKASDIGPGDEVITSALGFIGAVEAIARVDATPVLVDVEHESCNLDSRLVESAITSKTRAIVPVHIHGLPADMDHIIKLANEHGLLVIEDAGHAHGARYRKRHVGTFGNAGCFGFSPSSSMSAFGDAGIIVTDDSSLADHVRLLRDHGRSNGRGEHMIVGCNSRMDTLQAAVLRVKLTRLSSSVERRRAIARSYRAAFENCDLILPPEYAHSEASYNSFVVRTSRRGHLRRALAGAGIDTDIHFPIPVHLQPAYSYIGGRLGDFMVSERVVQEALSLPVFPGLTDSDVRKIADSVINALKQDEHVSNSIRVNGRTGTTASQTPFEAV